MISLVLAPRDWLSRIEAPWLADTTRRAHAIARWIAALFVGWLVIAVSPSVVALFFPSMEFVSAVIEPWSRGVPQFAALLAVAAAIVERALGARPRTWRTLAILAVLACATFASVRVLDQPARAARQADELVAAIMTFEAEHGAPPATLDELGGDGQPAWSDFLPVTYRGFEYAVLSERDDGVGWMAWDLGPSRARDNDAWRDSPLAREVWARGSEQRAWLVTTYERGRGDLHWIGIDPDESRTAPFDEDRFRSEVAGRAAMLRSIELNLRRLGDEHYWRSKLGTPDLDRPIGTRRWALSIRCHTFGMPQERLVHDPDPAPWVGAVPGVELERIGAWRWERTSDRMLLEGLWR